MSVEQFSVLQLSSVYEWMQPSGCLAGRRPVVGWWIAGTHSAGVCLTVRHLVTCWTLSPIFPSPGRTPSDYCGKRENSLVYWLPILSFACPAAADAGLPFAVVVVMGHVFHLISESDSRDWSTFTSQRRSVYMVSRKSGGTGIAWWRPSCGGIFQISWKVPVKEF